MVDELHGNLKDLQWNVAGACISLNEAGTMLSIKPPGGLDYWRETYYTPLLVKDDGPFGGQLVVGKDRLHFEATLSIDRQPGSQFDQGGLMVRLDSKHWIKAGIEVVDNVPRISCVVTNDYSDWSTQSYDSTTARFRVSQMGDSSYVVEVLKDGSADWEMMRICHLRGAADTSVNIGVFACSPTAQAGCTVSFSHYAVRKGVEFDHTAG